MSMNVAWGTFTAPDGTSYRQIKISDQGDWALFERAAELLRVGLRSKWTRRLDGLDQRYWDMEANGARLTLHLEHYLGITLYRLPAPEPTTSHWVCCEQHLKCLPSQDPTSSTHRTWNRPESCRYQE